MNRPFLGLAFALLLAACTATAPPPSPSESGSATAVPSASTADISETADLRDALTADAIQVHLDVLADIAANNEGIRAAGTPGYDASVAYAADVLREAGYAVTVDQFTFPYFDETAPVEITVLGGPTFAGGDHARALIFSGDGTVETPIMAVAMDEEGQALGSGGCGAGDWEAFPDGALAVVAPGPCFQRDQVTNAQAAGAAGLIVAYPSWSAGEVRRPTLLYPEGIDIPAVSASGEVGDALRAAATAGATVRLEVHVLNEPRTTVNLIADRAGRRTDEVVVVGGHLDSVIDGPGINDNGSGTMTILELAIQLADLPQTERSVRFALWSAEELGLYGSRSYVDRLGTDDRSEIVVYLNLDMIASPNFVRAVYSPQGASPGSEVITDLFTGYLVAAGLTWELTDVGGGSDHAPFSDAGIPVGGLFSGASELLGGDQAAAFGGSAGEPMSPCYHLACDTTDEINATVLEQLADAAAHVLLVLLSGTVLN